MTFKIPRGYKLVPIKHPSLLRNECKLFLPRPPNAMSAHDWWDALLAAIPDGLPEDIFDAAGLAAGPSSNPQRTSAALDAPGGANSSQVGGTHYKDRAIQPWDYITANNIGFLEGNAIKYLSRWKDKGGIEDIKKALHFVQKLLEVETAKQQEQDVLK